MTFVTAFVIHWNLNCLIILSDNTAPTSTSVLPVKGTKRRALLIGNGSYVELPSLSYSTNDAQDLGGKLIKMEFEVTIGINLVYDQMNEIIDAFINSICEKDIVIFFYAGHGMQWKNQNYFLPINDDELTSHSMLQYHAINGRKLLQEITDRDPSAVVFLLDCSYTRDTSESPLTSLGLCTMPTPADCLILFPCNAGKTVDEMSTNDRNGILTSHLLQNISKSNLTIDEIIDQTCVDIARETRGTQTPFCTHSFGRKKICFNVQPRKAPLCPGEIPPNAQWMQHSITVAGGNGSGFGSTQLSNPWGLYIDNNHSLLIADQLNHRIVEWELGENAAGRVIAGGNGQGSGLHQLNGPTDVIIDHDTDSLIICDRDNQRVVRWPRRNGSKGETILCDIDCACLTSDRQGFIYVSDEHRDEIKRFRLGESQVIRIAGGNGRGTRFDQFNQPRFLFVDDDRSLYVSDTNNHRVMKWLDNAREGILVAGGQNKGNDLSQLSFPQGILVDQTGALYIAEGGNNRIVKWSKSSKAGRIIAGGNHRGQLNWPFGISFDQYGNLFVTDMYNHRVQQFLIDFSSKNSDQSFFMSGE